MAFMFLFVCFILSIGTYYKSTELVLDKIY